MQFETRVPDFQSRRLLDAVRISAMPYDVEPVTGLQRVEPSLRWPGGARIRDISNGLMSYVLPTAGLAVFRVEAPCRDNL